MQSVVWTDDDVPEVLINSQGDTVFFDRPNWWAFAVGDQIMHLSEIGPSVYRVVEVTPAFDTRIDHYGEINPDYRKVTIQGV